MMPGCILLWVKRWSLNKHFPIFLFYFVKITSIKFRGFKYKIVEGIKYVLGHIIGIQAYIYNIKDMGGLFNIDCTGRGKSWKDMMFIETLPNVHKGTSI